MLSPLHSIYAKTIYLSWGIDASATPNILLENKAKSLYLYSFLFWTIIIRTIWEKFQSMEKSVFFVDDLRDTIKYSKLTSYPTESEVAWKK